LRTAKIPQWIIYSYYFTVITSRKRCGSPNEGECAGEVEGLRVLATTDGPEGETVEVREGPDKEYVGAVVGVFVAYTITVLDGNAVGSK